MKLRLLGGLSPRTFLQQHWQKRPLFVRGAIPDFAGVTVERELRALAARDDVESRIAERRRGKWNVTHGPFASLATRSRNNFTLLVSGVNLHLAAADELLRRFDFIPQARLDDVMVSFATPGGGVGPHVDSYDVFLLQGPGRRLWKIWTSSNESSPEEFLADPGDLIYVPPGLKHDGVALEACYTYSIGFRAPRGAELGAAFLDWLHERGLPDERYRDPGLAPSRRPARIPDGMIKFADDTLRKISWTRGDVREFLGRFLTEPKAHVVFQPGASRRALRNSCVKLDPKTQLLYAGGRFFLNGEGFSVPRKLVPLLSELADRRSVDGHRLARAPLEALISSWLRAGYARLEGIQR
jgi:50S ribosomal protein L16 3-hydroxylase